MNLNLTFEPINIITVQEIQLTLWNDAKNCILIKNSYICGLD